MRLPFRLVLELPDRADLRRAARSWRVWAVVAGIVAAVIASFLVFHQRVQEAGAISSGALEVTSSPSGAIIEVDGRTRGQTPATLRLAPGEHRIILRHNQYADGAYHISITTAQTTTLQADLWLHTPHVERLRPTFPGSVITNASFLDDGRIALRLTLPPGNERQLWLLDRSMAAQLVGPLGVYGPIALSPDGTRVAYLARQTHSTSSQEHLNEVWVAHADGERGIRHYVLPSNTASESLVDLSWAPDGQGLLVVSRQTLPGDGKRTQLRWVSVTTQDTRDLVSLPSEVAPGSYLWSPSGSWVGFLSSTDRATALCILDTQSGQFRYLADVSRDNTERLPFPPLAWAPDGQRFLYGTPTQERASQAGWLFGARSPIGLFVSRVAEPRAERLGEAEGEFPVWRRDNTIVALARMGGAKPLALRQVDVTGATSDVGEVPVQAGSTFGVRWDAAHAQAIIAVQNANNPGNAQPDYWLVRWRPEEAR